MINKRAFSILNIIILVCVTILGGIAVKKYLIKEPVSQDLNELENISHSESEDATVPARHYIDPAIESSTGKDDVDKNKASALPDPNTLPTISAKTFNQVTEEEIAPVNNGYYLNEKYNYSINFPNEWILKDEQADNVSIGYIPPKDGIGSMNIRIGDNVDSEIASLKKELKQYSGMVSLFEDAVSVAGEKAQRLILTNLMNNTKNYYLIFSHSSITYVVKYPYQSDNFFQQVETVLSNFKFIDK